jgi:hypothetical protein
LLSKGGLPFCCNTCGKRFLTSTQNRLLNRPVIAQILAESAAQLETAFAIATHMDVDRSLRQFQQDIS